MMKQGQGERIALKQPERPRVMDRAHYLSEQAGFETGIVQMVYLSPLTDINGAFPCRAFIENQTYKA